MKSLSLELSICILLSVKESSVCFSGWQDASGFSWGCCCCIGPKLLKTQDAWKGGELIWGARWEGVQAAHSSSLTRSQLLVILLALTLDIWLQLKVSVADHQAENKSKVFFLRYAGFVLEVLGNHDNSMAF